LQTFQQSLTQVKLQEDQVCEAASTLCVVRIGLIVKGSSLVGKIVDLVLDRTLPLCTLLLFFFIFDSFVECYHLIGFSYLVSMV
jgi:hypothetical protein